MNTNIDKLYMTEKEAVLRYSYSRAWFQRARWAGNSSPFVKVNGGRILYPIVEADAWFQRLGLKTSTSQI